MHARERQEWTHVACMVDVIVPLEGGEGVLGTWGDGDGEALAAARYVVVLVVS